MRLGVPDVGSNTCTCSWWTPTGVAEDKGVEDLVAFAASAVRDTANGGEVLERLRTGRRIDIRALSGEEEARLTFLAVRRWFGWSSGRLLVVDSGGGSLEICPWALRGGVILRRLDGLAA